MKSGGDFAKALLKFLSGETFDSSLFAENIEFHTPMGTGRDLRTWLGQTAAELELISLTEAKGNPVFAGELRALFSKNNKRGILPIAFTITRENDQATAIRVYHSHWPIQGKHLVREALHPKDKTVPLPRDIQKYHDALVAGDARAALELFDEKQGCITEPSGGISGFGSDRDLKSFFVSAFREGGIGITYHTIIVGAQSLAAEYTCESWGNHSIPAQAGMEFFDRGPNGFRSVRIYDDIEQPA